MMSRAINILYSAKVATQVMITAIAIVIERGDDAAPIAGASLVVKTLFRSIAHPVTLLAVVAGHLIESGRHAVFTHVALTALGECDKRRRALCPVHLAVQMQAFGVTVAIAGNRGVRVVQQRTVAGLHALTAVTTGSQTARFALGRLHTDQDWLRGRLDHLGEACAHSTIATELLAVDSLRHCERGLAVRAK